MKLEFLASLLQKDALELQDTLNLEEGHEDVSSEIAKEILENYIKEISVTKLSEGKKQGEGMAKKKVLSEAEKKLKEKFDLTGNTFDELIELLAEKMQTQPDNDQWKREKEILKAKIFEAENKLAQKEQEYEKQLTQKTIIDKITPLLSKYEFATDRVKQLALQEYINSNQFIVSDDELFIEIDGKPIASMDAILERHMLQFGTLKQAGSQKPKAVEVSGNNASYGDSISELLKQLKTAPIEEREAIKAKIKQIEQKKI